LAPIERGLVDDNGNELTAPDYHRLDAADFLFKVSAPEGNEDHLTFACW
jgi:hypothetical protein